NITHGAKTALNVLEFMNVYCLIELLFTWTLTFYAVFLPDTVRDTFLIDPAVILIVVGVVMFFITFCGCIGALRENIRLLKTFSFSLTLVFLTQLAIAILGFFYSDQTRDALGKFVKKAIVHYRDDLDLQNLMDYIQSEFKCCGWNNYTDWSWNLYFNCTQENPSSERCAVPYSCCTPVPGEAVINTMCGFGIQTQKYLDANKSIYPAGCADRAVMWIESHLLVVGALALGVALPQVPANDTNTTCRQSVSFTSSLALVANRTVSTHRLIL
uniref:Tetraspanin-33 n=1 Tax=Gouania willdenowi TaxID=441366 RepID=A0A8C5DUE2_GOUWI